MSRGTDEELPKDGKDYRIVDEDKTCSRCESPLDTTGNPQWCKKCRATYKREYERTRKDMAESRGFAAGVAATKDLIASEFMNAIRGAQINGYEAARLVRACRGPALPS